MAAISGYRPIKKLNLTRASSDVYYTSRGGLFRPDFDYLISELKILKGKEKLLSLSYQKNVLIPFIVFLEDLGKEKFERIMGPCEGTLSSKEQNLKELIPDVAEALLQRSHHDKYYESAFQDLQAFQAVVSTIHHAAVAKNILTPLPPLAVWSTRRSGPYTITTDKTIKVGVQTPIVCLPPQYRTGGLLAWSSFGHEVAGHTLLSAQKGLVKELANKVLLAIKRKGKRQFPKTDCIDHLATYWSERIDEVASDILGVLNTGPSSAIGFLGYLRGARRGLLKTEGPYPSKRSTRILHLTSEADPNFDLWFERLNKKIKLPGEAGLFGYRRGSKIDIQYEKHFLLSDIHPIDCLRVYAMLKIISLMDNLHKDSKWNWIDLIKQEVEKDLQNTPFIVLQEIDISKEPPEKISIEIPLHIATKVAEIAAEVIATSKIKCLKNQTFLQMFPWTSMDEALVSKMRTALRDNTPIDTPSKKARHIVAAAVLESLEASNSNIETTFKRMKSLLIEAFAEISDLEVKKTD